MHHTFWLPLSERFDKWVSIGYKGAGSRRPRQPCLCVRVVRFTARFGVMWVDRPARMCKSVRLGIAYTTISIQMKGLCFWIRYAVKAKITGLTLVLALGVVYGSAAPAQAESCEAHLAKHGTSKAADIAYHSTHGGESPCGYENKQSNSRVDNQPKQRYTDESSRRSRWQDKTSFDCGWSWKGGFGG